MKYVNTRSPTPICGAASPRPGAASIVSNRSATSVRSSLSKSTTGSAGVRSTGSPNRRIGCTATGLLLGSRDRARTPRVYLARDPDHLRVGVVLQRRPLGRVFHQGQHPAGHEPRGPDRGPAAGHLRHLDQPAAGADVHPPARPGRHDLVRLRVATGVDDDLHLVALHTSHNVRTASNTPTPQQFAPVRTPRDAIARAAGQKSSRGSSWMRTGSAAL